MCTQMFVDLSAHHHSFCISVSSFSKTCNFLTEILVLRITWHCFQFQMPPGIGFGNMCGGRYLDYTDIFKYLFWMVLFVFFTVQYMYLISGDREVQDFSMTLQLRLCKSGKSTGSFWDWKKKRSNCRDTIFPYVWRVVPQ